MKVATVKQPVMASWIRELGYRLDAPPFVSGGLEARKILERLPVPKEPLRKVTTGHDGGIYNGPHFSRTYVNSPEYGVPFVGSSDMLLADLSTLPLLSKKDAYSPKLNYLELRPGMTLISCSGTIGRTVYVRSEMKGMWSSQHIMKVVPDEAKIPPGYLYAFISSKFGIPIVISGTYGSIIQSIEAQHIENLPVPRFGKRLEQQVHDLVQEAADLRSQASEVVNTAKTLLETTAGLRSLSRPTAAYPFGIATVSSKRIQARFDAFYHSPFHADAIATIRSAGEFIQVADIAKSVVEPLRFKRVRIDDEEYGIPFFGTSAIMNIDPEANYLLVRHHPHVQQCIVSESTVLVPRSGQLSGIIGSAVLPIGDLISGAVTEDAIRINCATNADAGFVYIALSSEFGRRQLKARAFGSSIPHLDVRNIRAVLVPQVAPKTRTKIGELGHRAASLRHDAIQKERQAWTLVENRINDMGES